MANQEVKVFFKVEGLDGYITDLGDLQNALGQVDSATQNLTSNTDTLERDFESLEQKLDTLEGGVKVLAGSVEVAAGALGVLGIENEFFQQIEENVINIIALAEGAINISEGYRLLAQNQKIAAVAQRAFNAAANANPYILLASAIITAAGAIALYTMRTKDSNEQSRIENERLAKKIDLANKRANQLASDSDDEFVLYNIRKQNDEDELQRIQTFYQTQADGAEQAIQDARRQIREAQSQTAVTTEAKAKQTKAINDANKVIEKQTKLFEDSSKFAEAAANRIEDLTEAQKAALEAYKKLNPELEKAVKLTNDLAEYFDEEEFESTFEKLARLRKEIFDTQQLITTGGRNVADGVRETADTFADEYAKAFDMILEEPSKAAELMKRDVGAALTFAANLNEIFTKDNEKRAEKNFKIQKALSLSTAIINTAEGITTALIDRTQPSTILRIAQTAAVAAAGAAQIATIARQKYSPAGGGGNTPPSSVNAGASINYNLGNQQAGPTIQPGQLSTGQQIQPTQTYVLASDVTNAQEAQAQIENLARL